MQQSKECKNKLEIIKIPTAAVVETVNYGENKSKQLREIHIACSRPDITETWLTL